MIKPIEIRTKLLMLVCYQHILTLKGLYLILQHYQLGNNFENNGLVGYRIEYLTPNSSSSDAKVNNFFRIITSNNRAEPVNQNLTNTNQKL
jgi:hypothetical protein